MSLPVRLEIALQQIEFARKYTFQLLEGLDETEWFVQPGGTTTHLAWQIGHLAMAEYGLCLFRQRGRRPIDTELMSSKFRKTFSRGSTPDPDPGRNPTPMEIRDVIERVHAQVRQELPEFSAQQLEDPIDEPYAVYSTRLGALYFCSHHEMLHAGQIGLLRRLLGKPPIR